MHTGWWIDSVQLITMFSLIDEMALKVDEGRASLVGYVYISFDSPVLFDLLGVDQLLV